LLVLTHHPTLVAERLENRGLDDTVIAVNAHALRDNRSQCRIGALSCEQAGSDLCRSLASEAPGPGLEKLRRLARHLIVALGPVAALYCRFADSDAQQDQHELVYLPQEAYETAKRLDTDVGFTAMMSVGVAEGIAAGITDDGCVEGIKRGIVYCLRQRERGYGEALKEPNDARARQAWCGALFALDPNKADPPKGTRTADVKVQPLHVPSADNRPGTWSLLRQACDQLGGGRDDEKRAAGAMEIALKVIYAGLDAAAQGACGPTFPYGKIGALRSVDRCEVEGYQGLRGLMQRYLQGQPERPLCLAAFGPPGSGKSFGIKQVAASLAKQSGRIDPAPLEFNLSGFADVSGLAHALHQSRDRALAGRVPLVLIDEFDSNFDGRSLGWLKYLLAPCRTDNSATGNSFTTSGKRSSCSSAARDTASRSLPARCGTATSSTRRVRTSSADCAGT
jgi:hypothetical protein